MQDNHPSPKSEQSEQSTAAEPVPAVAQAEPTETMPSIEELLKRTELAAAEHHDAWLRAKAETENVRRRAQEDVVKAHKFAGEKLVADLLAVKDSLEAALANENQGAENLRQGVELTLRQLVSVFDKASVAEINPLGEKFDPHRHQAISQIEAAGTEPNHVVQVLQKGYSLHERVIRPALVVIAKAN